MFGILKVILNFSVGHVLLFYQYFRPLQGPHSTGSAEAGLNEDSKAYIVYNPFYWSERSSCAALGQCRPKIVPTINMVLPATAAQVLI